MSGTFTSSWPSLCPPRGERLAGGVRRATEVPDEGGRGWRFVKGVLTLQAP